MEMYANRVEVISFFKQGLNPTEIAKRVDVYRTTASRSIRRYRKFGSLEDRKKPGRSRTVDMEEARDKLRSRFNRNKRNSVRQMSKEPSISPATARRMLSDRFKLGRLKYHSFEYDKL